MAGLERGFPEELQEVLLDVARESWLHADKLADRARAFFFDYAHRQLHGLGEGETLEDRVGTALLLVFMAGREHALRGYRPPYPKEDSPDADDLPDPHGDEMPEDLEDLIERLYGDE